ncbi:MAG: 3-oxoacyl-ACP reductase FabG [Thermoplasmata archaeon]|nr:MAG: 3-oxoacyl-ACP reductase FabG [Thermoplasmata archaeon]
MRLENKVALITGGGSGIGEAVVKLFASEGAKVVIADINIEQAEKVAGEVTGSGGEALAVKVDISNKSEVEKMVADAKEKFGKIDILINNAGINRDAFAVKMREEQWDSVVDINLKGTFLCCQAVQSVMAEQGGGKIVNTSSIGALGNMGQANYAASKAGIIGLTKTLALEFARGKIYVNCIAPGATKTPMTEGIPPDIAEKIAKKIPLRRFAEPEEIAKAHLFLASSESDYITGQVIFVDGGISVGI